MLYMDVTEIAASSSDIRFPSNKLARWARLSRLSIITVL